MSSKHLLDELCLQQTLYRKIRGIQIRRCRRPRLLTPESWKMTLTPVLSFSGGMGWCSILLEVKRLIFEVFLHHLKCWNKNIVNVAICVNLNPLFHEYRGQPPRFGDCSPNHEGRRLLSAENCSHRLINVC